MSKWWEGETRPLGYVSFKVRNTDVIIGRRLDRSGVNNDFFNSIDGFLVVTESYIEYPISANVRWFPWKEGIDLMPDYVLYGGLKTLNHWVNELELKRVYIHCDLGSHRAPSIFGAFLLGYYKDTAKDIIAKANIVNNDESRYFDLKNKTLNNNPLEYIQHKISLDEKIKYLIETIVENPEQDLGTIVSSTLIKKLPDKLVSKEERKQRKAIKKEQKNVDKISHKLTKILTYSTTQGEKEFKALYEGKEFFVFICDSESNYPHGVVRAKASMKPTLVVGFKNSLDNIISREVPEQFRVEKSNFKTIDVFKIEIKN